MEPFQVRLCALQANKIRVLVCCRFPSIFYAFLIFFSELYSIADKTYEGIK